jgi:hypothetical protein
MLGSDNAQVPGKQAAKEKKLRINPVFINALGCELLRLNRYVTMCLSVRPAILSTAA